MHTIQQSRTDIQSRARRAGYDPHKLDAAVLVVGAGAIGQNTAQDLVLSGVREIRLVDRDRFEQHNITRSPLFPPEAHGSSRELPKAPLCAGMMIKAATHPDAVMQFADAWIEDLGAAAFDGVSVVVSCVDSLLARAYLSDRCRQLSLPLIEAGFGGAEVTVGAYSPDVEAACWRCGREVHDEAISCRVAARAAEQAGIVPAIQTAAAVAGGLQAEAVIQALHNPLVESRRIWLDVRSGESMTAVLPPDPACPHRKPASIVDVGVGPDAPLGALIDAAAAHVGGAIDLELPSPYIAHAACGACAQTITVASPGHRYSRNTRCTQCGGPWQPAPGATPCNGVAYVTEVDTMARMSCRAAGLLPGDVVVAGGTGGEIALRLAGGADDVFETAKRPARSSRSVSDDVTAASSPAADIVVPDLSGSLGEQLG